MNVNPPAGHSLLASPLTLPQKMQSIHRLLTVSALLAGVAVAQCNPQPPVTTLTTAGNGQNGTMFDIVNTSAAAVTIQSFEQVMFNAGTSGFEIYTKTGTWSGSENTASAWTLVGSAAGIAHLAPPALTALPIAVNVAVPAGATQAFYITSNTAGTCAYTTGVNQINTVIGTDGIINITAGPGKAYPFGASFGLPTAGRLWNGRVTYCSSGTPAVNTTIGAGCVASFNSFYELFADAAAASTALTGNSLLLVPSGSGYQGAWLPGTAASFFVAPVAATPLATGDDGTAPFTLASGTFPTAQGPQSSLLVSGNGIVAWGGATMDYPGTNAYTPTAAGFLNSALGGVYAWHDYNQAEVGSGQIVGEQIGNVAYVTFSGVESYSTPTALNPSTLQFQFNLNNGNITLVFLNIDNNTTSTFGSGHLVGVTAPGASNNPGSTSLATSTLLTVDPEVLALALAAGSRPVTGTNWNLSVNNIPATGVLGVEVFGLGDPNINDLFFLGLPGCGLRASLDSINAFLVTGSSHPYSLAIPANPTLVGLNLFATSAVFQNPPVNAFGAITSNGINGVVGDF